MAIYFLNLKTLGRAKGSSAVSAAAYRAGERIKDERTGRTYDHSGRRDVLHKEIMLPNRFAAENMAWAKDRGNLWNTAEGAERRSAARTAREYLVALPPELSPQARINLVKGFSRELVERYGFALDIAIHAPRNYPGSDPRNFHAHLLATTREVTPTGLGAKTTLEWSDTKRREIGLGRAVGELLFVRERWAMTANAALEQEHVNARIDHRTLKAQGIDREPKPHIPHAAFEMERRGYRSVVADRIRADYQARVEARLQRAAQHEPRAAQPRDPKDLATESALKRAARNRQAHGKSSDDLAKEAALRWKARYDLEHHNSPDDLAKESAMRWLRYREAQLQEQAKGKAAEKERVPERARDHKREHEREQTDPAPASAKRSRDYDLSL
jgi:ATP-dependent exoDNAse (exonuclease V) alpha subunit